MRIIEYENFVSKNIFEDHKIREQIYLMDVYQLRPVRDYEFVVPEDVFVEVISGKGYVIVDGIRHNVSGRSLIAYLKGLHVKVRVLKRKTVQRGVAFADSFMDDLYQGSLRFLDIRTSLLMNSVFRKFGEI